MRKLPVYLLLDSSGSMHGEPIEQVKNGLQMLVNALRQDPQALEAAYLSVITFDTTARQVVPLTELTAFQVPSIDASGVTALGEALTLAAERASAEVAKNTAEQKGDWKPMAFVMTDGAPTDDWKRGLERFRQEKWGMVVACGVNDAKLDVLKEIAGEAVIQLHTSDPAQMQAFFKWVSQSVSANSVKVGTGEKEVSALDDLPPPPPEIKIAV
jgi:uncharacterized protein YegL